ncbi:MAG: hypothetical protein M1814_004927 [Vezdaea aestivalis]|nr:MAG: hypothetical protein M1814_004927 [Vezdaea aestivalis]
MVEIRRKLDDLVCGEIDRSSEDLSSKAEHFDFKGLPLEIRRMTYRYLLVRHELKENDPDIRTGTTYIDGDLEPGAVSHSPGFTVLPKGYASKNKFLEAEDGTFRRRFTALWPQILAVDRQINAEGMNILAWNNTIRWGCRLDYRGLCSCCLKVNSFQKVPLSDGVIHFIQKIEIEIDLMDVLLVKPGTPVLTVHHDYKTTPASVLFLMSMAWKNLKNLTELKIDLIQEKLHPGCLICQNDKLRVQVTEGDVWWDRLIQVLDPLKVLRGLKKFDISSVDKAKFSDISEHFRAIVTSPKDSLPCERPDITEHCCQHLDCKHPRIIELVGNMSTGRPDECDERV